LLVGGSSVPPRSKGRKTDVGRDIPEDGNWQGGAVDVLGGLEGVAGPLEGEVDMEDDDILELDPEEEEEPPEVTCLWKLMGRYISLRKPVIDDMTVHFNKVWRLRTGVNFTPLGKNWFTITLYSEGDHTFVARGGPWIYRGYPLLVTKVVGTARPSDTVLNSVPLWVQVYDLPWNRQKKNTAQMIGNRLGN
jgi:hypothetical protein